MCLSLTQNTFYPWFCIVPEVGIYIYSLRQTEISCYKFFKNMLTYQLLSLQYPNKFNQTTGSASLLYLLAKKSWRGALRPAPSGLAALLPAPLRLALIFVKILPVLYWFFSNQRTPSLKLFVFFQSEALLSEAANPKAKAIPLT